jgi:hypothetical protein
MSRWLNDPLLFQGFMLLLTLIGCVASMYFHRPNWKSVSIAIVAFLFLVLTVMLRVIGVR